MLHTYVSVTHQRCVFLAAPCLVAALFCKFEDEGTQKYGMMVSYDNAGNILSTQHCYDEIFEMTGFFKKNGTTNQMVILTSGEEFATEDIITLNSNGLFQTISYKEIENYNFD